MDFILFAASHGVLIDRLTTGEISRCGTEGKPRSGNGAYFLSEGFGWAQDWATMTEPAYWNDPKERTQDEKDALKRRMEASRLAHAKERQINQLKAAEKARWILSQCQLDMHSYLHGKGFGEMLGNVWRRDGHDPLLVIPMKVRGELCGCQLISITGNKKFLFGQRCNDASFVIGQGKEVFLSEGYATGLSLHSILSALKVNHTIHVTFSASNMGRFAERLPTATICADHDQSGVGAAVAKKSGCRYYLPEVVGEDLNDEHKRLGLFAASQKVRLFLTKNRA